MKHTICALLASLTIACGPVDPPPPTDDDGNVIPLPGAYDDWLRFELVELHEPDRTSLPLRPVFALQANTYLDGTPLISYVGGTIQSGGISTGGDLVHIFTQRRLYWMPYRPLIDGLEYRVTFTLRDMRSVTGAPPLPPATVTALKIADATRPDGAMPAELRGGATWEQVSQIFAARCWSCHGQPEWPLLDPLTHRSLTTRRDLYTDRPLVRPFSPHSSYLLHKVLPDYPDRRGTTQPPPWSDDPTPLTEQELLTLERWIAVGAPSD
jgi:hypothetical protein